jgi:hypothetical protein
MNKERLLKLADFLDALPPERFNYGSWVGDDWKGMQDLSCGTTACALGWATTIPEIVGPTGLCLRRNTLMPYVTLSQRPPAEGSHAFGEFEIAAGHAFDLTPPEANWLFIPHGEADELLEFDTRREVEDSVVRPGRYASAKAVAAHIRNFVEHGMPKGAWRADDDGADE